MIQRPQYGGCLIGEKQLKHRIKELIKYRKHGITKLEGIIISLLLLPDYHTTVDCHDCERVKDKKRLQVCHLTCA